MRYISGETKIFNKYEELKNMTYSKEWDEDWIEGSPVFTNLFAGYTDMGNDVHNAMGLNVFRMISGTSIVFFFFFQKWSKKNIFLFGKKMRFSRNYPQFFDGKKNTFFVPNSIFFYFFAL